MDSAHADMSAAGHGAVAQESAVCADSSIGCVYTFPRGARTTHLVVHHVATGARVAVALEPPLAFGVATAELNRTGTLLLVVGGAARTALACIDVAACRARLAAGRAHSRPLAARTLALGAACVHRARLAAGPVHAWAHARLLPVAPRAALVVLRAHWHPRSAHHALVLTRDARLHLLDVRRAPAAPSQTWALAPDPARAARMFPPVGFACTRGPAAAAAPASAAGWAADVVHVVHADGAVSVLGPVVPRDPGTPAVDITGDVEGPHQEEEEQEEEEEEGELRCVVPGEGVVRVDTAYDVAVAAEHGACGAAAPCVLVRSDGCGRLDCFVAAPAGAPYALVDRVVLPPVPRTAAAPAAVPTRPPVVVVQDATRAADLVVLQPGRAHLLHVDYSVARDALNAAAPPALLVPLLGAPGRAQPYAGAALVVHPGAPPRIAVLEHDTDDAEQPVLHWCRCPCRAVLRLLVGVPPACRAPFVRALCPLPDDAAASPLLAALVAQLERAARDLHARAADTAAAAHDERPRVAQLAAQQDETGAAVARACARQDALWARVDALLAAPRLAACLAAALDQCSAELAAVERRVDARSDVISQVCCSHTHTLVHVSFTCVCALSAVEDRVRESDQPRTEVSVFLSCSCFFLDHPGNVCF